MKFYKILRAHGVGIMTPTETFAALAAVAFMGSLSGGEDVLSIMESFGTWEVFYASTFLVLEAMLVLFFLDAFPQRPDMLNTAVTRLAEVLFGIMFSALVSFMAANCANGTLTAYQVMLTLSMPAGLIVLELFRRSVRERSKSAPLDAGNVLARILIAVAIMMFFAGYCYFAPALPGVG